MLKKIIEFSVNNRFIIITFTVIIALAGIYAMMNTPIDAIPDLSDVQVIIFTEYPGQAPQVVEDQITYPLTTAMLAVPYAKVVRGYSFFGFSMVYIIFEDGTDLYWARSRVLEYLNYVANRLPPGVTPTLGPDATGVGWVYEYVLDGGNKYDLAELRSIQDWFLRYELSSVPGVAEVASIGGYVKQYQVEVDPNKLLAYGIPLSKVKRAILRSNNDVGGRLIEMGETEFMVRGLGYIKSIKDLENIPLGVDKKGTPILLKNVANIHLGPELRRGLAEWNGEGEIVGGIIVMRYGENALKVIENVKKKLKELEKGLPKGVKIKPAYDRSKLIKNAINTLKVKLIEECIIVALVCIIFLLHFRSAFVAIFTLPMGILISFLIMYFQGLNANIMSLGGIAIAIGAMVDAAIVMIENTHKHLEHEGGKKNRWLIVTEASKEVGPALFFSLLIITVSFMPVFTLQAQEGRLFKPLAFTKTYAMAAASLLSITIVPVLMGYLIRGKIIPEQKNPINWILLKIYQPVIRFVLRFRKTTISIALLILLITLFPYKRIGSEFMPPLNEGDLLYMPTTDPGISITKAKELLQQTDKIIKSFPEVESVFGKIGRAETATDPAPLSMIETTIILKPKEKWRPGMTMEKLIEELDRAIQFPGLTNAWTMPIKTRIDMLSTGIKTPVGIKLMGDDLKVLSELAQKIAAVIKEIPGTLSVFPDKTIGGNYLDFEIDREEAARYGLTVGDVQDVIMSAVGGMNITYTVEGSERYPVNLRYSRELRDSLSDLERILIPTPTGAQIPIGQVAKIKIRKGPPVIKSENARKTAWLYIDIKDIDVGTYVKRAQKIVNERIDFPPGYSIVWSGQYEYMQRAQKRLRIVVPITLIIIFLLLYFNFKNITESLIVMVTLPFSLVGGIWFMYILGYNMSVAVGVGFIALAGVTAEIGVIMLVYLDQAYRRRLTHGELRSIEDVKTGVIEGAGRRVRPIIMTVSAIIGGLLPIFWGHGTGSQVMKRIATPMVGGMISSTILTLLVLPAIYFVWKSWKLRREIKKINKGNKK
ncbi:efflux RND transporter permease subunit [SCandidatus Aminicenantes bacterium Aminicenantia_JdfR_composite]|jgi:Cu(I)/Ag(I) efflux system membrane protein CusA/SilA|nr:efflux RND transporter permease subunit [SCandidatus Aminicenantes bacterium Aminicenantia_JdfR_composite]MCP2597495.1 efflux RND transporter permease subunit [Candidatus Aminicenantes bacterium AC-335-G13]MCP2606558.1 efflux RND transporter permease subunit [Candidatus Aminicenantes bacterium AC-708-I09]